MLDSAAAQIHSEPEGHKKATRRSRLWARHRNRIIAEWVIEHQGTRPVRWWTYDASEPRKRLGGTGAPAHECLDHKAASSSWVAQWDVDYYTGTARDIHGKLTNPNPSGAFSGIAIDPDDPPVYESQA